MDVSVILFYNVNRGFLDKAINSYYNQIFSGKSELVIVHRDKSTASNVNEGIRQAKGKYIKLLGEDDELTPNCLQDLFNKAEEGFDVVCSNAKNIRDDQVDIFKSFIGMTVSQMAEDYGIHGGTVLYRKSALIGVGGMDESLLYAEEFDLHLRLAMQGCAFCYTDKITYCYRIHDHQKSMQGGYQDGEAFKIRFRYIRDLKLKYFNCDKIVK